MRDIARQDRLQIGVNDRGAQPIILADLRQHLGRQRDAAIRHFLHDDLAHARFVLGMQKREQEAHRDRLDALRRELAHGCAQRRLVELAQHVAAEIDAFLHFAGQARRHQRRGLVVHDVEDRGAVRPRLLPHGIDAAKSLRHQQGGPDAFTFEQGVGPDCGAVAEIADVGALTSRCQQCLDAGKDRARWVVGRRGQLRDRQLAGFFVEIDEIRKCPSGIDRDAVASHAMIGSSRERTVFAIRT